MFVVRKIVVHVSKKKNFRSMVAKGTLDGKQCNIVLSDERQHGDHTLHRIRELKVGIGRRVEFDVYLQIPCKAYSSIRESN